MNDRRCINLIDIFEACLGAHKEGLLFKGIGEFNNQALIVKYDNQSILYLRSADFEEKNVEWIKMGILYERQDYTPW